MGSRFSLERSHRLAARVARRYGRRTICAARFFGDTEGQAGRIFKHVICDTPLGEAVDAGIVKTPVLGRASGGPTDRARMRPRGIRNS